MSTPTTNPTPTPALAGVPSPLPESVDVTTSEGLRALLLRLYVDGDGAWTHDAEAATLMRYCMEKYAGLARKYGQTPEDAATAAFLALRAEGTIEADDPWAVVTRAVQLSMMADERADGLLCDPSRARRLLTSDLHEATRFSDYELDGARSVEAIVVDPAMLDVLDVVSAVGSSRPGEIAPTETRTAVQNAAAILTELGWDQAAGLACLEYITERLAETGDAAAAFESLRRDRTPLGRFDVSQRRWTALCSVVLGRAHHPAYAMREGLLARLVRGERISQLLADDRLVRALLSTCPQQAAVVPLKGVRCA